MIRTVLGDIEASELGVCYAHEHLIIDPSVATHNYPDFKLESVEAFRGDLAGWLLIGFGTAYLLWGIRHAVRSGTHEHKHHQH